MALRDVNFLTIWGEDKKKKRKRGEMKIEAILVLSELFPNMKSLW